jgi:hypothetical protein
MPANWDQREKMVKCTWNLLILFLTSAGEITIISIQNQKPTK